MIEAGVGTVTALVARGLSRTRGGAVVRDVSLEVGAGHYLAITGPVRDHARLLLQLLSTLTRPRSGSLHVNGVDAFADPIATRRRLAYVSAPASSGGSTGHGSGEVDPRLTVAEHLRFAAQLRPPAGTRRLPAHHDADAISSRVGLDPRCVVAALATHERMLLALAATVPTGPDVLLVEEPTGGFGAAFDRAHALMMEARSAGTAVVLATSDRSEATRTGGRSIWLDEEGRCSARG